MPRTLSARTSPAIFIAPMKALGSAAIPEGVSHCEIKFDGFRAIAVVNAGKVEIWSRNRKPMTDDFPEVASELAKLRCQSAVLDGEIVALDASGRSRFQLLQNRGGPRADSTVVYYVFDLMQRDGTSLMNQPLGARTAALAALAGKLKGHVQVSPVFQVEPSALFAAAKKNGLEGIIVKRTDSTYEPDRRSGAWLKCKALAEQEFVIGGFSAPQHSRQYFGALLVGYYEKGRLLYAGKVGTGFNASLLASLYAKFLSQTRSTCPFADLPSPRRSRFGTGMGTAEMAKVTWIKPSLVAQVRFAEWTNEGQLRQPVFLGLRKDKPAQQVRREAGPSEGRKGRRVTLKGLPGAALS
jgi:bifunctional non-homologous end joining protein LigD